MPAVTCATTSPATFDSTPDCSGATCSRVEVSCASSSDASARQAAAKVVSFSAQTMSSACAIGTATGPLACCSSSVAEVKVNVTGASPFTLACTSIAPTLFSVAVVLARPCALVVLVAGLSAASPLVAFQSTATPETTAPCALVTSTTSGCGNV